MSVTSVSVSDLEKNLGMEVYSTHSCGIGGRIRKDLTDFVVEEVLVDGSKATLVQPGNNAVSNALGSSNVGGNYLLCILVKRNWDTIKAVKVIADKLKMNPGKVQMAGIKDAKAVTAQYITIENGLPEEVKKIQIKDLDIYPIGYVRSELSSYFLFGNSFHIAISGLKNPKKTTEQNIAETIEEIKMKGGVPNFFGHQRFGTTRSITHLVGKALVQCSFKEAAMLFLARPSCYEHPQSSEARQKLVQTENFRQALQDFPKQLRYEILMLRHLAHEPTDFNGAFRKLPFKLRELFVQAYQSFLFNKFLSGRMRSNLALNEAQVGDFVVKVERNSLPMVRMNRRLIAADLQKTNKELRDGSLRLAIPLIGFRQEPSMGAQGEIENEILSEEGISPRNFRIEELPEISSKGGLRTILTPLNSFSLENVDKSNENCEETIKVSFLLHRGSYATVVLRELMKPPNLVEAGF